MRRLTDHKETINKPKPIQYRVISRGNVISVSWRKKRENFDALYTVVDRGHDFGRGRAGAGGA